MFALRKFKCVKFSFMQLRSVYKTAINLISAIRLTITPEYLPPRAGIMFISIGISLSTMHIVWGLFWWWTYFQRARREGSERACCPNQNATCFWRCPRSAISLYNTARKITLQLSNTFTFHKVEIVSFQTFFCWNTIFQICYRPGIHLSLLTDYLLWVIDLLSMLRNPQ